MFSVLSTRTIGIWIFKIFKSLTIKELDIVTPFLSDVYILNRGRFSYFLDKLARSADVSLITRSPNTKKQRDLLKTIKDKGVTIFINDRLHAKLILAKYSPTSGYALIGSANITVGGLSRNIELAIITDNKKMIRDLDQEIRKIKIISKLYENKSKGGD